MKIKTGVDIIEVSRIQESIESLGDKFLNKVFTKAEIEYCNTKNAIKYEHYAARFAAKEAVFKAISELIQNKYDISWKNIEITNEVDGRPKVAILQYNLPQIMDIDISLSHINQYAIATCSIIIDN